MIDIPIRVYDTMPDLKEEGDLTTHERENRFPMVSLTYVQNLRDVCESIEGENLKLRGALWKMIASIDENGPWQFPEDCQTFRGAIKILAEFGWLPLHVDPEYGGKPWYVYYGDSRQERREDAADEGYKFGDNNEFYTFELSYQQGRKPKGARSLIAYSWDEIFDLFTHI